MSFVDIKYAQCCNDRFNYINEHLPTLYEYAKQCQHVTECGVESCPSSWAFVRGLRDNGVVVEEGEKQKRLVSADLNYHPNISQVKKAAVQAGVSYVFMQGN